MSGQGRYAWPNGQVYEGDWSHSMRHGYGRLLHTNGTTIDGDWEDGKLHGKGRLTDPEGLHQFEADYIDGEMQGTAKYTKTEKGRDGMVVTSVQTAVGGSLAGSGRPQM